MKNRPNFDKDFVLKGFFNYSFINIVLLYRFLKISDRKMLLIPQNLVLKVIPIKFPRAEIDQPCTSSLIGC